MDLDIVKSILQNTGEDVSRFKLDDSKPEEIENNNDDKYKRRNPELISALSKSLAKLLCHRVSPAIHQRYSVRLNLIEQLRDWSRITSRYSNIQAFTDGEKTTNFCINLLKKYLTQDFIKKQFSVNILVKLGFAIIDIKSRNSNFEYKLDNIINRILYLDKTPDSDTFLDNLIDNLQDHSLSLSTIEDLYFCKVEKLIEIPIVDYFILFNINNVDSNNTNAKNNDIESNSAIDRSHLMNQLLKYSSKSPRIFQLLSSVMKEILNRVNCFEIFLNFVQFIIKDIMKICEEEKISIIDLYPRKLQFLVILLRIDPNLHTRNSKDYTFENLKNIYNLNKEEILILLIHFPQWVIEFSNFMSNTDDLVLR